MPIAAFGPVPGAVLGAFLLIVAGPAAASPLAPERRIEAKGDFAGKNFAGKTRKQAAKDISGIACRPPAGGERRCLVINDENGAAQFATLSQKEIRPSDSVALIEADPPAGALGRQPAVSCPLQGGFGEFDGEGAAFSGRHFYVIGSHGCSRRGGEFRASAFLLARFAPGNGGPAPVELSWRLAGLLQQADGVSPYFGKALDARANGLNIEGIAVAGDRLWLGLRAPSLDGRAFLIGGDVDEIFAAGSEPAATPPMVVSFAAGAKRGVRDLAALADGRLLVLVGPAQEQEAPYALMLVDPVEPAAARELGELRERKNAKAEAVTILAEERDELRVLVGYDGVKNGEFEEYRLKLR